MSRYLLGLAYAARGDLPKARAEFQKMAELEPRTAWTHRAWGTLI